MMHGVMAWQKLVNVLVGMVLKMIAWKAASAKELYYLKMMGYVAVKCFVLFNPLLFITKMLKIVRILKSVYKIGYQ